MDCKRSKSDPLMYYYWTVYFFLIWLAWIYNFLCVGNPDAVDKSRDKMKRLFDCDGVGDMEEYVGCKINCENRSIKFTQPVMVQIFKG